MAETSCKSLTLEHEGLSDTNKQKDQFLVG